MKIGLITLSRISANQSKYYNAQDLGLAKALARKGNRVTVYRLTEDITSTKKEGDIEIVCHKVNGLGKQSLCIFHFLDKDIERLICFSDNQLSFPLLYHWCKKSKVLLQPYVGVLRSNSSNKVVRMITNTLIKYNMKQYRELKVYGKTPDILQQLEKEKVEQRELVPVCLNETLLKYNYKEYSKRDIREKYGYCMEDRILLFIGRLEKEKEPIEIVEVLHHIRKNDESWKLLMVGKGELEIEVCERIEELKMKEYVQWIPQISNQEIWELYCFSDCFVNLNRHEIYGMSILEALYYQCPVVAMDAPGPAYILNNEEVGKLCKGIEELEEYLLGLEEEDLRRDGKKDTREYLLRRLSWDHVCEKFLVE